MEVDRFSLKGGVARAVRIRVICLLRLLIPVFGCHYLKEISVVGLQL